MTQQTKTKHLPKGWKEGEFGNMASFLRGPFGSSVQKSVCVPKGKETYKLYEQGNVINNDFGRGIYYLTKNKFKELEKFEVKEGDILITCAGTLGKIAIVPSGIEKGIINSVLMRIRVNEDKVNKKYFIYFFKSSNVQNEIQSKSAGVALKNLFATKQLKKFKIPLPPLQEQSLIVSAIETQFSRLDEAIKSLKSVKDKLKTYRKAVLKAAFEKKDSFKEVELGKVLRYIQPNEYIVHSPILKEETNIPVLTPGKSFIKGYTKEKEGIFNQIPAIIFDDFTTSSKYVDFSFKVKSSAMKILKPREKNINLKFIFYQMSLKKINFSTHKRYYISKYSKLNFLFPVDKEGEINQNAQEKIVQEIESKFSVIDKVEEIVNNSLKKAEQLKKSILKCAFKGELVK